jgi:hypothetical protein
MINLDELKPILKPLNLSAETIEAIQGLDKEANDGSEEIARLTAELDKVNGDWNERFKAAFFKGEGIPHDHDSEVTAQVDEQAGTEEEIEVPTTYEELFIAEEVQ